MVPHRLLMYTVSNLFRLEPCIRFVKSLSNSLPSCLQCLAKISLLLPPVTPPTHPPSLSPTLPPCLLFSFLSFKNIICDIKGRGCPCTAETHVTGVLTFSSLPSPPLLLSTPPASEPPSPIPPPFAHPPSNSRPPVIPTSSPHTSSPKLALGKVHLWMHIHELLHLSDRNAGGTGEKVRGEEERVTAKGTRRSKRVVSG